MVDRMTLPVPIPAADVQPLHNLLCQIHVAMARELRTPAYKSQTHIARLLRESSLCERTAATLAELMLKNASARPPVGQAVDTAALSPPVVPADDEECPGR